MLLHAAAPQSTQHGTELGGEHGHLRGDTSPCLQAQPSPAPLHPAPQNPTVGSVRGSCPPYPGLTPLPQPGSLQPGAGELQTGRCTPGPGAWACPMPGEAACCDLLLLAARQELGPGACSSISKEGGSRARAAPSPHRGAPRAEHHAGSISSDRGRVPEVCARCCGSAEAWHTAGAGGDTPLPSLSPEQPASQNHSAGGCSDLGLAAQTWLCSQRKPLGAEEGLGASGSCRKQGAPRSAGAGRPPGASPRLLRGPVGAGRALSVAPRAGWGGSRAGAGSGEITAPSNALGAGSLGGKGTNSNGELGEMALMGSCPSWCPLSGQDRAQSPSGARAHRGAPARGRAAKTSVHQPSCTATLLHLRAASPKHPGHGDGSGGARLPPPLPSPLQVGRAAGSPPPSPCSNSRKPQPQPAGALITVTGPILPAPGGRGGGTQPLPCSRAAKNPPAPAAPRSSSFPRARAAKGCAQTVREAGPQRPPRCAHACVPSCERAARMWPGESHSEGVERERGRHEIEMGK